VDPDARPAFRYILDEIKTIDYALSGDVDSAVVTSYVRSLKDSEARSHSEKQPILVDDEPGAKPVQAKGSWEGTPKDVIEADGSDRARANADDAQAQFDYAVRLKNGDGVLEDLEQAARYFKMSADQDHMEGQYWYEEYLRNGWGVAQDGIEAARCHKAAADRFKVAADRRDAVGRYMYAFCLENGGGVRKDESEAARCFKMAADQGHANSQVRYGESHAGHDSGEVFEHQLVEVRRRHEEDSAADLTLHAPPLRPLGALAADVAIARARHWGRVWPGRSRSTGSAPSRRPRPTARAPRQRAPPPSRRSGPCGQGPLRRRVSAPSFCDRIRLSENRQARPYVYISGKPSIRS